MLDKDQFIEAAIELYDTYREDFGMCTECDNGTSDMQDALSRKGRMPIYPHSDRQCEFEDKFAALICEIKGHNMQPDQCGLKEHYFCLMCLKLQEDL